MTKIPELNEGARPRAPKLANVTSAQRQAGRTLAAIHRLHLRDMAQVKLLIDRIEEDRAAAPGLVAHLGDMGMNRNLQLFGTLCGRECNHLLFHHGAEEQQIFPAVESRAGSGFAALVAKLREEHLVVHALLEDLAQGAQALSDSPDDETYASLRDTFNRLHAVLRSHFHYEETELEEALGAFNLI